MEPTPLSLDTPGEIERIQIAHWRAATPAEKLAVVSGLTQAVFHLALAGVRQRYPEATPREHFLRLAIVTLGPDVAREAYPDIDTLGLR